MKGMNFKQHIVLVLALVAGVSAAPGQTGSVPETRSGAESVSLLAASAQREPRAAAAPAAAGPTLTGVFIASSREELKPAGELDIRGLRVGSGRSLNLLRTWDFREVLSQFLGQPVTEDLIADLQREVVMFYRKANRPLVDVVIPAQTSVGSGVLQMFVVEAKLGKIVIEGNKWFERYIYSGSIRLAEGSEVNVQQLTKDIEWINSNPGRTVDVAFKAGEELGTSDMVLRVKERFPIRVYAGFDNNGTRFTAQDRIFAGVNWFNAFNQDHRLGFQYATDIGFEFLNSFSGNYEIPFPWRHTLTIFGGYSRSRTDFASTPLLQQNGHSWQAGLRYEIPLSDIRMLPKFKHDLSIGFDFKRFDNNLEFGSVPIFATDADVAQFGLLYRASMPDTYGATAFRWELWHSPGGLTANNSDAAYQSQRNAAKANYWYMRWAVDRQTPLPHDFSWTIRSMFQMAELNLLASEQMGLGGGSTVRGYDEREINGDQGWFISNELYTPPFSVAALFKKPARDSTQLLTFLDYGHTESINLLPGQPPRQDLFSGGVGLRLNWNPYLAFKFDYGWQFRGSGQRNPEHSRGHFSALLTF